MISKALVLESCVQYGMHLTEEFKLKWKIKVVKHHLI